MAGFFNSFNMLKKLSGGSSGEVSDFFAVIMFLAVSAFIIFTLKQNNELKALRLTATPPTATPAKPEVPAQKQKSVGAQKPDTDKYIKQLEKELEIMRTKITLLEQKNGQLEKMPSEKELLLQEKERQLNEKELTLEKKEKELLRKEEELNLRK
ncbi:MAG: hypothetical protein HY919_04815 [Elusimicrobia bacterium]|nr:hypothetical protein [Elusimicrobiota bacterium]